MFGPLARLYGPVVVNDLIPTSADDVYDVLADPTTYPAWLVGTQKIRAVDDRFPAEGSEFHHSVGPGQPVTVDDATESLGATPGRRLTLAVHAILFHARVEFVLTPSAEGLTEVCLSEQPTGPLAILTPLLRPSLAARNRKSLRRLATYSTAHRR
jgi:uncharacterized protein YndB with AHSA1/START domain